MKEAIEKAIEGGWGGECPNCKEPGENNYCQQCEFKWKDGYLYFPALQK